MPESHPPWPSSSVGSSSWCMRGGTRRSWRRSLSRRRSRSGTEFAKPTAMTWTSHRMLCLCSCLTACHHAAERYWLMITRVEVEGFKNLDQVDLPLQPFQAIAGRNAAGKSNLFDALGLLSKLAEKDLSTAFASLRGEPGELFSQAPDGSPGSRIRFAVELLVEPTTRDQWGKEAELSSTRLRYELTISRRRDESGADDLRIERESMYPIQKTQDTARFPRKLRNLARYATRREHFISTDSDERKIALHQDGRAGRKQEFHPGEMRGTVLSGVTSTAFRHTFAVREELKRWTFLQLSPEELRKPSAFLSPTSLGHNGSNLASSLARIFRTTPGALERLGSELALLVPRVDEVRVDEDIARQVYTVVVRFRDGREFSSRVLSDGTLRLVALLTLAIDPQHRGVVCLEEPENGVHPSALPDVVRLLRRLAVQDAHLTESGLRQILFNTHSPALVKLLKPEEIIFCVLTQHVDPESKTIAQRSHFLPVHEGDLQLAVPSITRSVAEGITKNELRQFLEDGGIPQALGRSVAETTGGHAL